MEIQSSPTPLRAVGVLSLIYQPISLFVIRVSYILPLLVPRISHGTSDEAENVKCRLTVLGDTLIGDSQVASFPYRN